MKADIAALHQVPTAEVNDSHQSEYTRPLVVATYTEEALLNPSGIARFVEGAWNAWINGWYQVP